MGYHRSFYRLFFHMGMPYASLPRFLSRDICGATGWQAGIELSDVVAEIYNPLFLIFETSCSSVKIVVFIALAWLGSQSSPCRANGFSISSLPSTGLMTTNSVPRATTRPRDRVASLPSSSGSKERDRLVQLRGFLFLVFFSFLAEVPRFQTDGVGGERGEWLHTSHDLLYLVQHQVHKCIISL